MGIFLSFALTFLTVYSKENRFECIIQNGIKTIISMKKHFVKCLIIFNRAQKVLFSPLFNNQVTIIQACFNHTFGILITHKTHDFFARAFFFI